MPINTNAQTALIQIGVLLSEFIEPGELPTGAGAYGKIIEDNLGIKFDNLTPITVVRDLVVVAIKERDDILALDDWFHNEWLKEDLAEMMAIQIRDEVDGEIIEELKEECKGIHFDQAMKGI